MSDLHAYLQAADPECTMRSYASAIRQYDGVKEIESLQRLEAHLADRGVAIDDLVESSLTDYPL